MYIIQNIKVKIQILAEFLDNNIENTIKDKAKKLVLGKEINNIGLITTVKAINKIQGGEIQFVNGISKFSVEMLVKIYSPKVEEIIKTKVKDVSVHGYFVDEPIETFVGTDNDSKTSKKRKLNKGDDITIQITKIGFNKNKFIILAKQIK